MFCIQSAVEGRLQSAINVNLCTQSAGLSKMVLLDAEGSLKRRDEEDMPSFIGDVTLVLLRSLTWA